MKNILSILGTLAIVIILHSCAPQRNNTRQQRPTITPTEDIIIYDNRVVADPVSFEKDLAGEWKVLTMRRQQKEELEYLSGITLNFDTQNNKFSGQAPCNKISGSFTLNGAGIRLFDIISTKMGCDKMEQETYYLKLLSERISAFTIKQDKLYLADVASNIVFECERMK